LGGCLLLACSGRRWSLTYPERWRPAITFVLGGLLVLSFWKHHLQQIRRDRVSGLDGNSALLKTVGQKTGLLLVGDALWDAGRIQLRTRRPVLLDLMQLNMLLKVPQSGPRMAYILKRAYSLDFEKGPPTDSAMDDRWVDFSLPKWQEIRREFNVTEVLVRRGLPLALPEVASSESLVLYTIPAGKENPAP
jgi:hypothetical protein